MIFSNAHRNVYIEIGTAEMLSDGENDDPPDLAVHSEKLAQQFRNFRQIRHLKVADKSWFEVSKY